MKKVFKFVKGKKDERKESGGITSSQSVDFVSPAQTPEDERFLGLDNSFGYFVDFCGKDKTLTKLHKAAWQGNLEKLKTALKKVDVDAVDRHNRTALHFAVAQGHPNIVWFLLGNNAKTSICDDEGHTPLLKAIECGHKECMNLLLERGADVNVADYTGNTGLHVAINQASVDIASALLKKGAETEVSNNAGDYPLHIATRLENKDLIDLLLHAGAFVDVVDRENRTPLMLAAKSGNCLLAQIFVEHGAQLSVVDSNGWTAQDYAMLAGHENLAASIKSFMKHDEKKTEKKSEDSDLSSNDNSGSWEDSQTETCDKQPITQKLKKFFEKCSKEEEKDSKLAEREKNKELPESPDAELIPPYCQPPRSWEMIQAGMIDENKNGHEPKRRSITTLGTLHSRRKSFTEGSVSSPQFTLSLNRRKGAKGDNAFAKQRFSFNEEESLRYWINEEKTFRKELEKIELENMMNLEEMTDSGKRHSASESDWDSVSVEDSQDSKKTIQPNWAETDSAESHKSESKNSESGTLGREGTMNEVEEIWVANPQLISVQKKEEIQRNSWDSEDPNSEKEGNFPPPPTALELGIDMAKSIKYMKGISVDQPLGCSADRNLWKNFYESHSWDCLEERDFRREIPKETSIKGQRKHPSVSTRSSEEVLKCQKPGDRFTDVSKRINEQLECYDQALRELAETRKNDNFSSHNYYSLPSAKTGNGGECRRASSQELAPNTPSLLIESGPHSLPFSTTQWGVETNERLRSESSTDRSAETPSAEKSKEKLEKKTKRHMLLAMRDIKHAVHVSSTFNTSTDYQILSPLKKTEDNFDLDEKSSSKGGISDDSGENSPPDENPFFGMGRQETVLERGETGRKSSSSGTGEEPTLWLQEGVQKKETLCPDSDDDVSDIAADEKSTHKRVSSFSPLGVIQREMEEENQRNKSSGFVASHSEVFLRKSCQEKFLGGENEERNEETFRDPSPDISLSSGPIEPIGAEKDSGSEPESSHCDASPAHNYALKSQHEWLKCHLKVATSEKNKLEELTAQLAEKAERLQYELADAKEAAKSRDEVIQLLQDQLARMETAYTKSLEESVQSRLQLTSHEQEILHLKELCYRYEEEKGTTVMGIGDDFLQELQLKIRILEEEKERMRKEIIHLEEEKSVLEKALKQEKKEESEMLDQCQRWKERCEQLEEMAKVYDSKQAAYESYVEEKDREYLEEEKKLKQENFQLEKKFLELNEENIELKAKIRCLTAEQEAEKRKASERNEKCESVSEMKKKNCEMVIHLKDLEKKMEEKMLDKLKEKEKEIGDLLKQFNRERESLIASYEKKLSENRSELILLDVDRWRKENQQLKQTVKSLQDQIVQLQMSTSIENTRAISKEEFHQPKDEWDLVSKSVADRQFNALAVDNLKLRGEMCEIEGKMEKEIGEGERRSQILAGENAEVKSEILELKSQVNSLRMMLNDEGWPSTDAQNQRNFEKRLNEKSEGKKKGVGKEDELAWSSLYGMKAIRRKRGERSTSVTEALMKNCNIEKTYQEEMIQSGKLKTQNGRDILHQLKPAAEQETENNQKFQKLELFKLEKEILSLQSKMSDEKNLRQALENQIIKMNVDLSEKENLEKDINSLKRKMERDCLRRSEIELLQYQKDLETKQEKYLDGPEGKTANNDFKTKCEILAEEREKFKTIRNSFRRAKSLECPPLEASFQHRFNSCPCPRPHTKFLVQSRFVALDPDLKHKLEQELDKSIRKYVLDSSSAQSVSNLQIDLVKKTVFK